MKNRLMQHVCLGSYEPNISETNLCLFFFWTKLVFVICVFVGRKKKQKN